MLGETSSVIILESSINFKRNYISKIFWLVSILTVSIKSHSYNNLCKQIFNLILYLFLEDLHTARGY